MMEKIFKEGQTRNPGKYTKYNKINITIQKTSGGINCW